MENKTKGGQLTKEQSEAFQEQIIRLKSELNYYKQKLDVWDEIIEEGLFAHENFIIKEANIPFARITGYPVEELLGMHGKDLLTPESFLKMQDYATSGSGKPIELEMKTKSGEIRWVHTKGKSLLENGKEKRVVIVQDITIMKQTYQSLDESEHKYRSLVEGVNIGIGISKNEKILFANQALLNIYGIATFEELASKKLTEYMPPDSKKAIKARIRKYKEKIEQSDVFRHDIIRSDGEIRTVELTTSELVYNGEKCRQVFMKDITDELKKEKALIQAANIFTNIQQGLFIYRLDDLKDDHSLRMIAANPASTLLVGITENEMIGKTLDDIFPNLRKNKIPQQYAEVVRSQIPVTFDDIYYEDVRVEPNFFSVKVFPLPDQCVGVAFENTSERRKAELELRDRNRELNNFVYKVSHDLRAPLNSIQGLISLSRLDGKDYSGKIEERISYLDGFIRDILSHSRNLNVALIIEKVDVAKMTQEWFDELKHIEPGQRIEKSVEITGVDFYSDKIRLSEIIRNLVSNAIKYHDATKSDMFIRVKGSITKDRAEFTFEDNGIGIRKEFIGDIFTMFYRATDTAEGTGIGLYIVKQAVAKLNGEIEVKSTHGAGSIFTLRLPNLAANKNL